MGKQALVSVVLPAYNSELYIKIAIQSILDQTYTNFELIIIDDGSSDGTKNIIQSFSDNRIRFFSNETNLGLITTLNKGIDLCQGEFIVRMDADDISLKNRIKKQVAFMQKHPDIAVSGSWYKAFNKGFQKKVKGYSNPNILKGILLFNTCLCHPATIIRKNILDKYNFKYDLTYKNVEDYDLWIRISKVAQLSNVPEFLFLYRTHNNQISQLHTQEQKLLANSLRKRFLNELGFIFSDKELDIHNLIAGNIFINSKNQLNEIETWLISLINQNKKLKCFDEDALCFVASKFWLDSCGYSNLGFWAFKRYFKSELKNYHQLGAVGRFILMVKCMIRKIKK